MISYHIPHHFTMHFYLPDLPLIYCSEEQEVVYILVLPSRTPKMPRRRSTCQDCNPRYEHFQDWSTDLASFFYGFEAGIEKLHPKERRTGIYCKLMYETALLIPCPEVPDSIELIMAQPDEERLIDSLVRLRWDIQHTTSETCRQPRRVILRRNARWNFEGTMPR